MKNHICYVLLFLAATLCVPAPAGAVIVELGKDDIASAIQTGAEQGDSIAGFLDRHYSFGSELLYAEKGIMRTKWYKLAMLAGLLASQGRTPSNQETQRILASPELQLDVYTYGATIDFAKNFSIHLVQKGKILQPVNVSADHAAYRADKNIAVTGFPSYRATVRAFFPYSRLDLNAKAQVILVKNGSTVIHEVNFADYR